MDDKYTRVPTTVSQYRPSKFFSSLQKNFRSTFYFHSDISDHMTDDLNQITNPIGIPIITPPFSHLSHQHQHSSSNNKRDDDHLFLHPSCIADNHRRIQDTYAVSSSNNGSNIQHQMSSVCII
jgi:hypothetical protein